MSRPPATDASSAREAFERFVVPELPVLLRVARSLTRHDAEAEDLVQDTLLRAYRGIGRFDGRHPRAWLLTICRNAHRNNARRARPEVLRDGDGGIDVLAGLTIDEQSLLVEDRLDAALERALGELPERFRRPVELVDLDGLSYAEAAAALGVPVGTVMSRLHRARRRLRAAVEREGLELGGGR
ncbi:MAG: sigma-70 family RNA polymerase sigma factor [Acidimicrobiia bacterium]